MPSGGAREGAGRKFSPYTERFETKVRPEHSEWLKSQKGQVPKVMDKLISAAIEAEKKEERPMITFHFTEHQRHALRHRLEVPDCIAEANELDQSFVESVCKKWIQQNDSAEEIGISTQAEADILTDCFDGSTYFNDYCPHAWGTKQRYAQLHKSFENKGNEIFKALRNVGFNAPEFADVSRDHF